MKVSWGSNSQLNGKKKIHVPNHQPDIDPLYIDPLHIYQIYFSVSISVTDIV